MIEQTPYVAEMYGLCGFRIWARFERTEFLKQFFHCETDEDLRTRLMFDSMLIIKQRNEPAAPLMSDPGLVRAYFPDVVEDCARVYAVFEVKGKVMTREFFITNFDDEAFRSLDDPERKAWQRMSILRQIYMRFPADRSILGDVRLLSWIKIGK